jgi:hypothetical protein
VNRSIQFFLIVILAFCNAEYMSAQSPLFLDVQPLDPDTDPPLGVSLVYPATIDYVLLRANPSSLLIEIPKTDPFVATRNRFEPRAGFDSNGIPLPGAQLSEMSYLWRGHGDGNEVVLTVVDGTISGLILGPVGHFTIRTTIPRDELLGMLPGQLADEEPEPEGLVSPLARGLDPTHLR